MDFKYMHIVISYSRGIPTIIYIFRWVRVSRRWFYAIVADYKYTSRPDSAPCYRKVTKFFLYIVRQDFATDNES